MNSPIAIPTPRSAKTVDQLRRAGRRHFSARCWPENASIASGSISAPLSIPCDGRTAEELLSNSHMAFCRAKATRRGGHVLFERAIRQELETRLTLEAELANAVERNEFELFYQPQMHLAGRRVDRRRSADPLASSGARPRLARRIHPGRQHVVDFGTDCRMGSRDRLRARPRLGNAPVTELRVGVNLSPSQIRSGDLAASVAQAFARRPASAPRCSNWRSPKTSCCMTKRVARTPS